MLSSQGWKPGQGLGARDAKHFNSLNSAIKLTYKDDTLGLGATLKSGNSQHARTGLDAFQGLLGRLNSKDEAETKKIEQRSEQRKLSMFAQGKWGGVMFVPGGLLVQGDKFKTVEEEKHVPESPAEDEGESSDQKAARRVAKALRKAEKRERKEKRGAQSNSRGSPCDLGNNDLVGSTEEENGENKRASGRQESSVQHTDIVDSSHSTDQKQQKKRRSKVKDKQRVDKAKDLGKRLEEEKEVIEVLQLPTPPSDCLDKPISRQVIQPSSRNGRHVIRGRNIQAKRMAFADTKRLDEVRQFIHFWGKVADEQ